MEEKILTYDLIYAAAHGDPKAQEKILSYYDEYINSLSTVEEETRAGRRPGMWTRIHLCGVA